MFFRWVVVYTLPGSRGTELQRLVGGYAVKGVCSPTVTPFSLAPDCPCALLLGLLLPPV